MADTTHNPPATPPVAKKEDPKVNADAGAASAMEQQAEVIARAMLKAQAANAPAHVTAGPTPNIDKAVPGGRFLKHGRLVNAHDQDIDEEGNLLDPNQPKQGAGV